MVDIKVKFYVSYTNPTPPPPLRMKGKQVLFLFGHIPLLMYAYLNLAK